MSPPEGFTIKKGAFGLCIVAAFFCVSYLGKQATESVNTVSYTSPTSQIAAVYSYSLSDFWCDIGQLFNLDCEYTSGPSEYAIVTPRQEDEENTETRTEIVQNITNPIEREVIREVVIKDGEVIDTSNFITRDEYNNQVTALLRSIEISNENTGGGSSGGGSGSVTSVDLTVPTALTVSGGPITSSGTFALSLTSGYNIPLTASTTEWSTAYASTTALTPSYLRGLFSNSATGLTYNSTTGATSLTSGYTIPLTASTTEWATAYSWGDHSTAGYLENGDNATFTNATTTNLRTNALSINLSDGCVEVASGLLTSTGTNCGSGGGGITSLNGQTASSQTFATSTSGGIDLTITSSGGVHTFTSSPTSGYTIPLTASTTEWSTAYASTTALTPSYLRGLFSNSATGLTYNSTTGATSLTSGYVIPLTASTTEWATAYASTHDAVTLVGEDYLSLSGQQITANAVNPDNLASTDFGDFTCNGTSCSFDTDSVSDNEIDYTNVTLNDFTFDIGNVSKTEFGYLDGITSSIQTQLDSKLSTTTAASTYLTITTASSTYLHAANNLGDLASASTARTNLGLGSIALLSSIDISDNTNLAVSATGLTLSGDTIALTAGYSIPLTASTTEWSTAYASTTALTPSYFRGLLTSSSPISYNSSTGDISFDFSTNNTWTGTNTFSATTTLATSTITRLTVSGITSLGTIDSGIWNGSTVGVPYGGTGATSLTGLLIGNGTSAFTATTTSAGLASIISDETGSGSLVFSNSPTFTTPNLGTPSAATLTNATGLPVSTGISGLGSGIATWLATPSSANLISAVTDETGTGSLVFSASPTLTGNTTLASASTTNLTVSGNSYLGTVTSGTWNGSAIDISDYTNLSVTATGLELSGDTIALTSGYNIPLTASTTNWNNFYDTPSTRITAGTGLSWSTNTLNASIASTSLQASNWTDKYVLQASSTASGGMAWVATSTLGFTGSSSGTGSSSVAFSVHRNGANQTVTVSTLTVIDWTTESFDTNSNFDLSTDRFTPTIAGKYIVTGHVNCSDSTSYCQTILYKNGSSIRSTYQYRNSEVNSGTLTEIVEMNGTTDYLELAAINGGGTTIFGAAAYTHFSGALIAPSNGLAGGWSNDETQSYLADYTDLVAIGTTTASAKLDIWGTGSGDILGISSSTGTRLLTLTNTGRLGIGTTTPSTLLSVAGTSTMQTILPAGPFTGNMSNYDLGASSARWNEVWAGTYNVGTSTWSISATGPDRFGIFNAASGGGTETLSILNTGQVGVGTTTPSSKLSVYGDLFIEGSGRYLNFGTATSSSGYGIRDNSGTLEWKNSGGDWAEFGTGSGGSGASAGNPSFVFSSSTAGSNISVNFNGSQGAAPSFSGGVLTLPSDTETMIVEVWGAGGGGSGGANGGTGGTGGTSCFGTNATACTTPMLQATGGGGGGLATSGTAGTGSGGDINMTGGGGGGVILTSTAGGSHYTHGGVGGTSPSGGGAGGTGYNTAGGAGAAFGGGGAGGGANSINQGGYYAGGTGGGGGGYSQEIIGSPSGTYYYTIGAGGTAGSAGSTQGTGYAGGAGGAGGIVITVYTASGSTANGVASSSVAFSVNKDNNSQTVTTSTWTKVTWSAELFDTNNNFASDRFSPTIAGKYLITGAVYCTDNTGFCEAQIYKNGSGLHGGAISDGNVVTPVSVVVDMNGTTDYVELYAYNQGGVTIHGSPLYTYFTGALIAPSNGLAGGWSNDETQSYLADINDLVAIGTSTATAKLDVWGQSGSADNLFGISSSTGTRYLTVTSAGNVGIGTSTPSTRFSVVGTSTMQTILPGGPYTGNMSLYDLGASTARWNAVWAGTYNVGTSTWSISATGPDRFGIFNAASAGGTEALSILSNGNIGIGSTTPSEKLTVGGNILLDGSSRYISFGSATGSAGYGIRDNAGTLEFKSSSGDWQEFGTGSGGGSSANPSFVFASSTAGSNISVNFNGSQGAAPSFSGSTLTLPSDTQTMIVEVWGAGGGGSGSGPGATAGSAGGQSCFGTNATACTTPSVAASGGGGGSLSSGNPGAGGSGTNGDLLLTGGSGAGFHYAQASTILSGGTGGSAPRGGGGGTANYNTNGGAGAAYGGGGAGAGNTSAGGSYHVPGAGGGGYAQKIIGSPSGTYYYTIGAGGAGGSAGTGAFAGGSGGAGGIVITIYTQSGSTANGVASSSVAFSVSRETSNQTVTAGVLTQLDFNNENFDTNNNFDLSTDRFTPTIAGKYVISASAACVSSNTTSHYCGVYIQKNGSNVATSFGAANNGIDAYGQATIIVDMNGTTDYLEAYVISSVTGIGYESRFTRMTGALIAPSNGLAGGWSNDETQSYLADYTDLVAIGTSTAAAKLDVWGNAGSSDILAVSSSTGSRLLTLSSTGHLGIGTTTPTAKLLVQGTSGSTDDLLVISSPSGGSLLSVNSGGELNLDDVVASGSNTTVGTIINGGTSGYAWFATTDGVYIQRSDNTDGVAMRFYRGSSLAGSISITSSATTYNTSSDRRVKENINSTRLGLDTLMRLPVRDFSFIDDDTHATTTGFIAQELYEIFPWAVSTNGDDGIGSLNASSSPWAVDYGRVTPLLVKSIQDLNLKLEDLATTTPISEIIGATSTGTSTLPTAESFTKRFFTKIISWFADTANGIGNLFAKSFKASEQICIGETCINEAQLIQMLNNGGGQVNSSNNADSENNETESPSTSEGGDVTTSTNNGTETATSTDNGTETSPEEPTEEETTTTDNGTEGVEEEETVEEDPAPEEEEVVEEEPEPEPEPDPTPEPEPDPEPEPTPEPQT